MNLTKIGAIPLALLLAGGIALLNPASASRAATDSDATSAEKEGPGTYAFCQPYSTSLFEKAIEALRFHATRGPVKTYTEAEVLQALRQYGGVLIRYEDWREVSLYYNEERTTWAADAIAVTDKPLDKWHLAFIHERVELNGGGYDGWWLAVSALVTTPICIR